MYFDISMLLIINESLIDYDKINESQMKVYYLRKAADIGRLSLHYIYNIFLVITSDCADTMPSKTKKKKENQPKLEK